MITFTQLGQLGRLGNQLFQYAALRGLALEKGYESKIPDPTTCTWHGQKCLLGEFNIQSGLLNEYDIHKLKYRYQEPDHIIPVFLIYQMTVTLLVSIKVSIIFVTMKSKLKKN